MHVRLFCDISKQNELTINIRRPFYSWICLGCHFLVGYLIFILESNIDGNHKRINATKLPHHTLSETLK